MIGNFINSTDNLLFQNSPKRLVPLQTRNEYVDKKINQLKMRNKKKLKKNKEIFLLDPDDTDISVNYF